MTSMIESMLEKYKCETQSDYERAIHEAIQEATGHRIKNLKAMI